MDGLPESFSTGDAHDILKWQGSRLGLARHLEAAGYVRALRHDAGSRTLRYIWRRPPATPPSCTCRCHTGTWGANDMDLAERAIQLIEMLRPLDVNMIEEIERLVDRAGVDYAKAALRAFDPDSEAPL